MISIALVEDHNIVRKGIRNILNQQEGIEVIADVDNGAKMLDLLENGLKPSLIVIDINMPGINGITLLGRIKEHWPEIKIVVLSMYDQIEYIHQAFKNGAVGYLLKNISPEELLFSLRHLTAKEERYVCTEIALSMLDRQIQAYDISVPKVNDFDLSPRELQVLNFVSEGYTNLEIAERLYTSKRTIEGHRQNLIDKTGVRNSSALIRFAFVNGLIS